MQFKTKPKLAVDIHISYINNITSSTNFLGHNLDSTLSWKTHIEQLSSKLKLFKKLNILPLHSQHILSLLLFVVKNTDEFKSNFEVHSINTCHRSDLFPPAK
jgi:hypothetical protein